MHFCSKHLYLPEDMTILIFKGCLKLSQIVVCFSYSITPSNNYDGLMNACLMIACVWRQRHYVGELNRHLTYGHCSCAFRNQDDDEF